MAIDTPHDTDLYSIGKGILYIAPFAGAGEPAWTDVGNCPSLELELNEEKLPHFSSRSGLKRKDKEVIIEAGYSLTFLLDEFGVDNLAKFLKGNKSGDYTIYGLTNMTAEWSLKFESDNPEGQNQIWTFHRCTISPNGALQLISDEWMGMSFRAEGLDDIDNNVDSPYYDVVFATTTTTTTTTSTTTTTTA